MINPFKYGKEVTGYQFYDRKESSDELYRLLKDGVANVVLFHGPARGAGGACRRADGTL